VSPLARDNHIDRRRSHRTAFSPEHHDRLDNVHLRVDSSQLMLTISLEPVIVSISKGSSSILYVNGSPPKIVLIVVAVRRRDMESLRVRKS
jgi:hypothetical protein